MIGSATPPDRSTAILDRAALRLANGENANDAKHEPTTKSGTTSPARSVNSPEFRQEMIQHLKDCVRDGVTKLAPGNKIHWTPEELAAMTPEQRARCQPAKSPK
jgi:hypothetical protein